MMEIVIKQVETNEEIIGIKHLQTINLKENIPDDRKQIDGFVTAVYSIDFLQEMNQSEPSIIAIVNNEVIGYILVTSKEIALHHPLLKDLKETIDQYSSQNQQIRDFNYILSGQVCIARDYRGQGLIKRLYQYFQLTYKDRYDYCITEVDDRNQRSVHAHLKCGFEVIYSGSSNDEVYWHIILWNWNKNSSSY